MRANVKKIGSEFEQELCELLTVNGFWVHFITPDKTGSQPFDIIAVKNNIPIAIDCKTCEADTFNISRLEDNQIMAFGKWLACGNEYAVIFIKHKGRIYFIPYDAIVSVRSEKILRMTPIEQFLNQIEVK